jgi:hypothetical protein
VPEAKGPNEGQSYGTNLCLFCTTHTSTLPWDNGGVGKAQGCSWFLRSEGDCAGSVKNKKACGSYLTQGKKRPKWNRCLVTYVSLNPWAQSQNIRIQKTEWTIYWNYTQYWDRIIPGSC